MPLTADERTEAAARRLAARQDLRVEKCRARNPDLPAFGTYRIIDPFTNCLVCGHQAFDSYGMTLDEVMDYLRDIPSE